jgi:hypothetical protein
VAALELATHAVGAKVLNGVLEEYPREETRALRSELYGREAALLLEEGARGDLAAVLSAMPERAQTVMAHMVGLIQRMLDKGVATLPFAQVCVHVCMFVVVRGVVGTCMSMVIWYVCMYHVVCMHVEVLCAFPPALRGLCVCWLGLARLVRS